MSSTTQMALPPSKEQATPTICCAGDALSIFDVTERVFKQLLIQRDLSAVEVLGIVNKAIHENIISLKQQMSFVDTTYLQNCFSDVRVLDTNILPSLQVYEKFRINEFLLVKGIKDLTSHIEGDAGVSILVMRVGTTLNELVEYAGSRTTEEEKMEIHFYPKEILTELGDDAVEETYVVLITNNVFEDSRDKDDTRQWLLLANKYRCELPTALEYIGLIVLTRKIFNRYLYGQEPLTYGRSSTHFGKYPLVIGGSALAGLHVSSVNDDYGFNFRGAGGCRKF